MIMIEYVVGLTLSESNGGVKGKVNKLKVIKRKDSV